MKRILQLTIMVAATVSMPSAPQAQGTLVDQQSESLRLWNTLGLHNTFGQEFVPSFTALSFVDLWLHNNGAVNSGVFQISIREGSLDGALLGTSGVVTKQTDSTTDLTRFAFPVNVALRPGNTYVIELLLGEGDYWNWDLGSDASWDGISTPYPMGRMIRDQPVAMSDLTFREGVTVPEPKTVSLWLLGALVGCFSRRSSLGIGEGNPAVSWPNRVEGRGRLKRSVCPGSVRP